MGVYRFFFNHFPVAILLGFLTVFLGILFWKSFLPGIVVFSNDASYGYISAAAAQPPECFSGIWWDLNWLGGEYVTPSLSMSALIRVMLGKIGFMKFYPALSLLIAGVSAGFCLWKFRLTPAACILAGLAAGLNMDFFSNAAWGVAAQVIGFGACYLALGFLADTTSKPRGVRLVLAGLAVGFGVVEAFDIGAIFSMYIAAFLLFQALFLSEGQEPLGPKLTRGFTRLAVIVLFSAFIASHALSSLVGTQIKGVAGTDEDEKTKAAVWSFATQWSVPVPEGLQVIVPGLFGYRMNWPLYDADQPGDDRYWGGVGRQPQTAELQEQLNNPDPRISAQASAALKDPNWMWRFQGNGIYAGAVVFLIGLWGVGQAFKKNGSPFTLFQKRTIKFWFVAAIISLLLGFGKHMPFYKLFYMLPYAHTIRNPIKFMHVLSWIMVILFGYGVHGLVTAYMQNTATRSSGIIAQFKAWRSRASEFDRKFVTAWLVGLALTVIALLIYTMSNKDLAAHIQTIGFSEDEARGIAKFSLYAAVCFFAAYALTTIWLVKTFSGGFAGPRAKWVGVAFLGLIVVLDLGNADRRWIVNWDVPYKYASDDLLKFLSEKNYNHRVTSWIFHAQPHNADEQLQYALAQNAYGGELKQNLFLNYNIQALEIIQEPRISNDKVAFMRALQVTNQNDPHPFFRLLELTCTKYLIGPSGGMVDGVNSTFNMGSNGFQVVRSYNYVPKVANPSSYPVDYKAEFQTNGLLNVIEFKGALPRAGLYSQWQIVTNDDATLAMLPTREFDPHQTVLVASQIPAAPSSGTNGSNSAGTVIINPNYQPKRVELEADVKSPAVLLLCDRFNPRWTVSVDGKPEKVLRCNYIQRGVYLPTPGKHTVVFEFTPAINTLYVNAAADALGVILLLVLARFFVPWLRSLHAPKTA